MKRNAIVATLMVASFSAAASDYQDQGFCKGKKLDANYPHPDTCTRYISCDLSGRAQDMPCVKGLEWMPDETRFGHCDYPHVVHEKRLECADSK